MDNSFSLFRDLAAVSGRRISRQTFYSGLAQNVLYTRSRVVYVPLTASHGTDRIFVQLKTSAVFLSVISGSSPNVFIWRECELAIVPPT
ncbi:hypothetical protein TNCV_4183821 [Trichonephila clavipes]|nr:hypothetical protein TNCV_4183821 [Trichonephila clavipes]